MLDIELNESAFKDIEIFSLGERIAEASRNIMDIGRELEPTSINL